MKNIFYKSLFWSVGILISISLIIFLYLFAFYFNFFGTLENSGSNIKNSYPDQLVQRKIQAQIEVSKRDTQILFGDTHVHSTYSTDAFLWSLPNSQGEGPHLMADACDYARFCSAIDFWVMTDHAEASTPRKWGETIKAVQNCNKVNENKNLKDLFSFVGFEWTQISPNKEDHFGHKNVIFLETDNNLLPGVPFGAAGYSSDNFRDNSNLSTVRQNMLGAAVVDFSNRQRYADFLGFVEEILDHPDCDLKDPDPRNCYRSVVTPRDLFVVLDNVKSDSIVIPHGNTWGYYTPSESSWDKQLSELHDPDRQISIEIFSGHGNSEEYRSWSASKTIDSVKTCPEPSKNYLPSCWRAGEIVFERCINSGLEENICLKKSEQAKINYIEAGQFGHWAVTSVEPEKWLNSGQCSDCFVPAFNMRPKGSVQYALALRKFSEGKKFQFDFGFIASSDNHRSKPGTGYKAIDRLLTTEANGAATPFVRSQFFPYEDKKIDSREVIISEINTPSELTMYEAERQSSFFTTGGLAAVHVETRSKEGIWSGFKNKETYATSGPQILLWFDLITTAETFPMGSKVDLRKNPVFEVKAVGSYKQKPGCPEFGLSKEESLKLDKICGGECFNPSDVRRNITRIEVIKITPQNFNGEPIDDLIQDVWKVFECKPSQDGCKIRFSDKDFQKNGRDSVYYVRAIEEPSLRVNGDNLRCDYDENGNCIKVNICHGSYLTDKRDDCVTPSEERAWSSPIFVNKI